MGKHLLKNKDLLSRMVDTIRKFKFQYTIDTESEVHTHHLIIDIISNRSVLVLFFTMICDKYSYSLFTFFHKTVYGEHILN